MKPATNPNKGVDYWTTRISEQEMPALCSTIKSLEKLAKDDVSSMGLLGRSVMHDNALTSRILRVANSAIYNKGVNQVTTVSRAAVVLGFDTIRNICITAKLLSSLLENKNLSSSVYQRLLKLMAQSFQAAMLAKMMLSDHDEALQEEVFIAALLYHLGESAFWSMGGELAEKLDVLLTRSQDNEASAIIREELGTSFGQLSQGIARNWGLGEVLIKSLVNPDERTPEIRSIFLANKISELLAREPADPIALQLRIKQAADMLDIESDELKGRMIRCTKATQKLAEAYGAKVLLEFLPDASRLVAAPATEEAPKDRQPDLPLQLKNLRELTQFALKKTDFNTVIQTCLDGILCGIGMDRCGVFLLSPNRKLLQPRIVLGDDAEQLKQEVIIALDDQLNLFRQCIELKCPFKVDSPLSAKWRMQLDAQLQKWLSPTGFMLAPLLVDNKVIGIFYADRAGSRRTLDAADYDSFTHFTQLANLCLSNAMRQP